MASKKEKKLTKEEKPEDKESSYPDLGVGWKVRERWTWSNMRSKWQSHKEYISPSGKKFKSLKSVLDYIDFVNELGPDWTVKQYSSRKHYTYTPTGQDFPTLKQAKAYVASLAVASNTQDEGEVEEKENDTTGASSSTLASTSGSMDIDSAVDGDDGAKSKKGERKQPPKRKRIDTDSNSGNKVNAVDDEERLRQENKLRCEEQERAETEKQADKRRKEEDKLKREEDAKNRKLKEDRKRKRVEEEEEKRRFETVSWSLICVHPPCLCF